MKVSRGTQEYPLTLRHLAMELFLTVPALLSCSVGVHRHASWRVPPEYALFHSVNCAHLPGEAFHFLSILSVCHLPNVPRSQQAASVTLAMLLLDAAAFLLRDLQMCSAA